MNKIRISIGEDFHGNELYVIADTRKEAQGCRITCTIANGQVITDNFFVAVANGEVARNVNGDVMKFALKRTAEEVARQFAA